MKKTEQMKKWESNFGEEYIKRNIKDIDSLYAYNFGKTRTKLNNEFIGEFDKHIKILEVGSNIGLQLNLLQKSGFKNLYGIEINEEAIEISKEMTKNIYIIKGSAFDVPFRDNYFDLVFTSGVLIHIAPEDIKDAINEVYRVSKRYIWGFEYFSEKYTEVEYRGEKNLLWKANFAQIYLDTFKDLRLIKENRIKYLQNANIDQMFLLEKVSL